MTVSGPKVRDFTDQERRLPVEVAVSPVFELLLRLCVLQLDEDYEEEGDEGPKWRERLDDLASAELRAELAPLNPAYGWLGVLGYAHDAGVPNTVEGFLDELQAADPTRVRAGLLATCSSLLDPEVLTGAAQGDQASIEEVVAKLDHPKHRGLCHVISMPPAETVTTLVDVLGRARVELLPDEAEIARILERDAAEKRALAPTMSAERLVEVATNGITFSVTPQISEVVLIPSIAVQPWVMISEYETRRIFCYPVAEEHLTADPDAAPGWLVKFYKALGDERRLRILGILSEGDASLRDLADRTGLAKSTVSHHLRILRTAGLVRVVLGVDKEYGLRADAIPHAGPFLENYLSPLTGAGSPSQEPGV